MPAYNTLNPPPALYPSDIGLAFNAEKPASGSLSQQYAMPSFQGESVGAVSVEVSFAAAPGAFEFDVYESDTDTQNNYLPVPVAAVINAVSANNVARVDLAPFVGSFIAIKCVTQNANAVNATVKITRKV